MSNRQREPQATSDLPDGYANLDELAARSPKENPEENHVYRHESLEEARNEEQAYERQDHERTLYSSEGQSHEGKQSADEFSKFATQLYTLSYLILFSFFGTLARLGLQAITFYQGAPVVFSEIWANFGGCLLMGFLSEDRKIFKNEWGTPTYHEQIKKARHQTGDAESGSETIDLHTAKKAHNGIKKTIPMYLGLTTGLCGCFTSFSSFIRDVFLALSNALPTPQNHASEIKVDPSVTLSRNGGYSFMALVAVIITTVALCVSGLIVGAHFAIATESYTPSLPFRFCRRILDPLIVFVAFGGWLGAVFLAIFPPDRNTIGPEIWRGRAVFALVFAPLGCIGRFYVSLWLNGKISSFPLGTFAVNIFGTMVLGMAWDLQHTPIGGVIGCQVLQGIEDGFCGCLTTVSTWVSELVSLRRRHAYIYGATSVIVGLCVLIIIMGSLQWTIGFAPTLCLH